MNTAKKTLLSVEDLEVEYRRGRRHIQAVRGVSFEIREGETLGLVGESGSGKSTIGKAILGLAPATRGRISFDGEDITHLKTKGRRLIARDMQVIFQDPYSSLDPTKTIGYSLLEPILLHERRGPAADEKVQRMLKRVGLHSDAIHRYPAQFSGGQRQRIAIARALMLSPRLVICDEPVSALDLSIQAEVMNLLAELQAAMHLSLLFISHDLTVVQHISDRVAVLNRGRIVEMESADTLYASPQDDYTRTLLAAAPTPDLDAMQARRAERQKLRPASA